MSLKQSRLLFISPSFLFPSDTGGKIRTSNILRGLKGGAFDVTLLSPASPSQQTTWGESISQLCDQFVAWSPAAAQPTWRRALGLWQNLPISVVADRTAAGLHAVQQALADPAFDVVVFDFIHCAVLRPEGFSAASVCFTHNVEAEIYGRHVSATSNALMRRVWAGQHAKMLRFEQHELRRFSSVVAVSERDAHFFRERFGLTTVETIPTGVDLDYFAWRDSPPMDADHPPTVVFTGSMDWAANIDGIRFFLAEVWPRVLQEMPQARFVIVGRSPPAALVAQAQALQGVSCSGFVADVRPYVHGAHVFVIPLRVGGGTRIKAFEAMAMGCPVVSTAIGIEGLDIVPQEHFLLRDSAEDQARGVLDLLGDSALRRGLSTRARKRVEDRFGHRVAAQAFEQICLRALERHRAPAKAVVTA